MVATPIGHLGDITLRALDVLAKVDIIACEDTRHTSILLNHYQIKTKLISYYEYNKQKQTPKLINLLKAGKSIALVSDAGTPGISDPGYYLIREAIKEKIAIFSIPGPSAVIAALVISGLSTASFVFEGFLPKREGRKRKKLAELKNEKRTIVFYESPYRLLRTLCLIYELFGDRQIVVVRELTKKFETVLRGRINEIINEIKNQSIKGEIVIVLQGVNEL